MLEKLHGVEPDCRILDPGAGCGGRARVRKAGLGHRIAVRHGVVEDVPEPDAHFDIVRSQDCFLHSEQRERSLAEAFRVLQPGGTLIFTDPGQADDVPEGVPHPVYDRR